jgi:hypothetical protein
MRPFTEVLRLVGCIGRRFRHSMPKKAPVELLF